MSPGQVLVGFVTHANGLYSPCLKGLIMVLAQSMQIAGPEHFFAYLGLTAAFLFLVWLLDITKRPLGTMLVMLGVGAIILAIGYGLVNAPPVVMLASALVKAGFVLVLGGVGCCALERCASTPASKEADHE